MNWRRAIVFGLVLVVPALLIAGGLPRARAEGVLPQNTVGRWQLSAIDGARAGGMVVATISADGRITGNGPCNRWSLTLSAGPEGLRAGPINAGTKNCIWAGREKQILAALAALQRIERRGERLDLIGDHGVLSFLPAGDLDPDALPPAHQNR